MSTSVAGTVQVQGLRLSDQELREALEYDKILTLRDDVFAGRHPRLKIPLALTSKSAPKPVHSPVLSSPRSEATKAQPTIAAAAPVENRNGIAPVSLQSLPLPLPPPLPPPPPPLPLQQHQHQQMQHQPSDETRIAPPSHMAPAPRPSASGIDPVLLTKSDDLVRAEIQLKRQRIERVLREQLDNRRAESKHKDPSQGGQDFDFTDILARAFDLVTPVSEQEVKGAGATTGAGDSSDSFDENSLYSSRVVSPVATSEGSRASYADYQQGQPMELDSLDADIYPVDSHKTAPATRPDFAPYRIPDAAISPNHSRINEDDARRPPPQAALPNGLQFLQKVPESAVTPQVVRESPEEDEYSPPEPIPVEDLRDSPRTALHNGQSQGNQQPQNGRREPAHLQPLHSPTAHGMPIVRNNVRSPVAPQPARISPLATNKPPPFGQDQAQLLFAQNGGPVVSSSQHSARHSPAEISAPPLLPQKRRRAAAAADRESRVVSRHMAESPEPRIKEEPVSPPHFTTLSDARPAVEYRRRARESPGYEEYSVRDPGAGRYYIREYDPTAPSTRYEIQSPSSPVPIRTSSRTSLRRPVRDEQDLRRVASIQYARQPASPPLYPAPVQYAPISSRSVRASSHAFVERMADEPHRYYRESVRPAATHHARDRSRSPQPIRERYASVVQVAPPPMNRPPRRIIIDQHGNEYYAAPTAVEMRQSAVPQSRLADAPIYYDEPPPRERIIRVPFSETESYEDGGSYVHRMGPPASVPRHHVEHVDSEAPSYRAYRQRDYSARPAELSSFREAAPREIEYLERRPAGYPDDVGGRRIVRTHSVVPGPEYVPAPRLQSVRPEPEYAAGLSHRREAPPAARILHEPSDDGRRYAEYVPDEERISYVPPHHMQTSTQARRYVDEPVLAGYGREMVPDGAGAGAGRVYRY